MTQATTPRRALIVVDVQNIYADGPLLIEYPPVQDSLVRIGQAMDAAHAAGIPIVVVQEDGFGKGTQGWKIHDVVASRASDHHIHKTTPSAFTNTGLAAWLAEHDINTLSVVGYMTHNCNASTLFEARHLGLSAEFLPTPPAPCRMPTRQVAQRPKRFTGFSAWCLSPTLQRWSIPRRGLQRYRLGKRCREVV